MILGPESTSYPELWDLQVDFLLLEQICPVAAVVLKPLPSRSCVLERNIYPKILLRLPHVLVTAFRIERVSLTDPSLETSDGA